ncbi:MAG: GtrA family protein [Hyphomicrobiaceae bacterium]
MSVIASLLPDVRAQFWRLPAFARFLVLGGISAGVNLVARVLLQPTFSFGFAVVVAYVIGMVVAYNLFRLFVFGATGRSVASEASRFTLVNMVALALVWVISMTLARVVFPFLDFTWHADDVAHVIGVASPAVTSWVGHRRYTFRPH